ncbi:prophage antirepressor [Solidesulfovibrio carbinoliphilus subsp. oakridgensis]|uniref:Prophage antirepressor n=1 Tax=Solidesulfovibrio carbinoliphilus subsp. oakridgensis TaxID=694327 RepID=G7QC64_9BACT|nr:BRO family protein [Solidesulfovibrio carbinoliphilus]EHJ49510.1 prophage antirepressor [Solidesulfovibrio carbinoliphilus subsp. oakridgensis]
MASAIISEPVPTSNPVPFAFESHEIRTVINGDGNPWFVARDVCAAMNISWQGMKSLSAIPDTWKRVGKLPTRTRDGRKQVNDVATISEPAVYKLAFRSNKPEADRFTNWIASEVIPALRRQGKYEICPTTGTLTAGQQQEIKELVQAKASAYPDAVKRKVFSQIWMRLQRKFKVPRYEELPVSLFGEARDYVIAMQVRSVDAPALEGAAATPALPPAYPRSTLDDYKALYRSLPPSPQYWMDLLSRYLHAHEILGSELEAVKAEATKPFRVNRKSGVSTYFDEAMTPAYRMFDNAERNLHLAYCQVFDAMEGFRSLWLLLNKG